jgi:hypothetical protein
VLQQDTGDLGAGEFKIIGPRLVAKVVMALDEFTARNGDVQQGEEVCSSGLEGVVFEAGFFSHRVKGVPCRW